MEVKIEAKSLKPEILDFKILAWVFRSTKLVVVNNDYKL